MDLKEWLKYLTSHYFGKTSLNVVRYSSSFVVGKNWFWLVINTSFVCFVDFLLPVYCFKKKTIFFWLVKPVHKMAFKPVSSGPQDGDWTGFLDWYLPGVLGGAIVSGLAELSSLLHAVHDLRVLLVKGNNTEIKKWMSISFFKGQIL